MKRYPHLNDVYITHHLKDAYEEIKNYRVTTLVAPMGYGKSTYVKWCAKKIKEEYPDAVVIRQELLSDNTADMWDDLKRMLDEDSKLVKHLDKLHFPRNPHECRVVATIIEDDWTVWDQPVYYILDNIQLLEHKGVKSLVSLLAGRLPENVHFILVGRSKIFNESDILSFGSSLFQMKTEDFKIDSNDIREYVELCGLDLTGEQLDEIMEASEGWISIIYLLFKRHAQGGQGGIQVSDATKLMEQVVCAGITDTEKEFLIINALADQFTKEQAVYMLDDKKAGDILDSLVEENSFISPNADGTYRYHGLLKKCALEHFETMDEEYKKSVYLRLAKWQQQTGLFYDAEKNYEKAGDYDGLLSCIETEGKRRTDPSKSNFYIEAVKNSPAGILKKHPNAILSIMLVLFSTGNMPEMKYLSEILVEAIRENDSISEEEKNNLHGERELLLAFLDFNDSTRMNICQRKAMTLMTRTSNVINKEAPWNFGAPSVLGLYHRKAGDLKKETESVREGLAAYMQLTDGHGSGADSLMEAEASYLTGNMMEAEYAYHVAIAAAKRKNQYSIVLAAEYLAIKIAICRGDYEAAVATVKRCNALLKEHRVYALSNTYDMMKAWIISQFYSKEEIAEWIMEEKPGKYVSFQAIPQLMNVKNEILLAKREFAKVAATEVDYLPRIEKSNMTLCLIYQYLQMAVAHNAMGHKPVARGFVMKAMDLAIPDNIMLPFVEVCDCICDSIRDMNLEGSYRDFSRSLLRLSDGYREAKRQIMNGFNDMSEDFELTDREWEVAKLAGQRRTNKEIAEELHLSDYTVKNHLKNIFDKVGIKGNDKNKRILLAEKLRLTK